MSPESTQQSWWSAGIRMHHPNMRDLDVRDMDFDRFVEEAASLHSNAVVISAAGIVAFYPSALHGHYVSELLQGRDFVGEVTRRAHAAGLKVIARIDFSAMRKPVFDLHPDWQARDATDKPILRRQIEDLFATCPNSPYRREGFAIPVVQELLDRYPLDGFHVNGGGWPGLCHCDYCQRSFRADVREALPTSKDADPTLWARYVEWAYERVADSFRVVHEAARETKPDVFYMGELGLRWGSYDLPSMAPTCSALLITTGDVVAAERTVRSWAGLAARYARTADPRVQPLVNLKVFVKSGGWPRSMVPPAEYRLWVWQAIANGAGLKTPVFGTFEQEDRRNIPAIRDGFALMERYPEVYAAARPVAPVALVWPRKTMDHWRGPQNAGKAGGKGSAGEAAVSAFNGSYEMLVERHVQLDVLADGHLTPERLTTAGYRALVLPCAACLSDAAAAAIAGFVERGGGLILTGWTGWADELGRPRSTPALAALGGVVPLDRAPLSAPGLYLAPTPEPHPRALAGLAEVGLITAEGPAPAIAATPGATVALRLVRHGRVLPVEAIDEPVDTGCAGLVLNEVGKGRVATLAVPVDECYWRWGLADYRQLVGNLLDWCTGSGDPATPWPIETEAPGTVEVTLARNARQRIVHFVNATGPEPLREVIPVRVGSTRVALESGERCVGARRLVSGGALAVAQVGPVAEFDLGELGAYEVVVLEVR